MSKTAMTTGSRLIAGHAELPDELSEHGVCLRLAEVPARKGIVRDAAAFKVGLVHGYDDSAGARLAPSFEDRVGAGGNFAGFQRVFNEHGGTPPPGRDCEFLKSCPAGVTWQLFFGTRWSGSRTSVHAAIFSVSDASPV